MSAILAKSTSLMAHLTPKLQFSPSDASLTPEHVKRTRKAFCSIKQPHHEVAASYLYRIRVLTRNCYHAGIPNTDAELIKRTVRGGSNHSFYAASYQRFDADIRRAKLHDEALPPFAKLESHLLNIDESRGLTLPSQNQRHYNQHANSARQQSHHFPPRQPQVTNRTFTPRQQKAFSSILRTSIQSPPKSTSATSAYSLAPILTNTSTTTTTQSQPPKTTNSVARPSKQPQQNN